MKIFIIHSGRHEYLKPAIKQLLKYNNSQNIIFLTDDKEATKQYLQMDIIYENIADYHEWAEEFAKIYQHMSYNKYEYELFCFQRWLILLEYIEKNNIDLFWHIDSDVLCYCDFSLYYDQNLNKEDFCYVGSCGHVFIWSKKWLSAFKDFLFLSYKQNITLLNQYFTWEKISIITRNNGSVYEDKTNCVTDMTLFYLFIKSIQENGSDIRCSDIGIVNKWIVFDNCIHMKEGFQYWFWLKKIKKDKQWFYWYIKNKNKNKQKIYFKALHFQWKYKKLMSFFSNESFGLQYKKTLLPFGLKKLCLYILEFILKKIGIYKKVRSLYINYLRKWVDPTK